MTNYQRCDCDPNALLERERQYSQWDDTSGAVWCSEHRVWVRFTAPAGEMLPRAGLKVGGAR